MIVNVCMWVVLVVQSKSSLCEPFTDCIKRIGDELISVMDYVATIWVHGYSLSDATLLTLRSPARATSSSFSFLNLNLII